jgi:hypothetical protein
MNISLEKLLPRVIVVAAVGYIAWPSASYLMSQTATPPVATLPEVAKALLSPTVSPPMRDPFARKNAVLANAGNVRKGDATRGQGGAITSSATASPKDGKSTDPLSGLTLDATYLAGNSRLAIINGRVYAPQETLPASKTTVIDILPYKVLLECEGKVCALAYADTASARSVSSRPAAARAKSSGGARSATSGAASKAKGGNK